MACLESNYQIVQPQGSKDNYGPSGVITYNWSVADPTVWVPSKSFFRCQIALTVGAARPTISRCLTLAENAVANSIQTCSLDAGGVTISKITTASAQISALKMRRGASRAWLNSVGASAAGWGGTFSERLVAIASDTNPIGVLGDSGTYCENINRAGCAPASSVTVAITAAVGTASASYGLVTLVGGTVTAAIEGAKFVIGGYYVGTVERLQSPTEFAINPPPLEPLAIASTDWYFVQRDTSNSSQGKHIIEVLYQPPLGVFDPSTPPLGGGAYRCDLTPFADFQNRMVEALSHVAWVEGGAAWNVAMQAPDLYLYTAKHGYGHSAIPFPLREYQSYSRVLGLGVEGGNSVIQLTVPRSTSKIHIFLQQAGCLTTAPASKFTDAARNDLKLTSVQVSYAGQTKWKTPLPSCFAADGTNRLALLYYASLVENDKEADEVSIITARGDESSNIAPTSGGAETMREWIDRGPIFSMAFNRSASGSEVDAVVDINYSTMTATSVLFIVAEYNRLCTITSQAGQVVDVKVITN